MEKLILTAVGDIGQRIEENNDTFDGVRPLLAEADINVGQLESPIAANGERAAGNNAKEASDVAGGAAWQPNADAAAKVLADNYMHVMSFASNHTMDCGDIGLKNTIDALADHGIATIGAGMNIADARKPLIIERKGTKVAFLAYCSVHPAGFEAGENSPGLVPLRGDTYYQPYDLQPGMRPMMHSCCNKKDLADMERDIKLAKEQADVVVVSMHWGVHWVPDLVSDYQVEACHAAIDAGADLILGQHPHIMKGVEVYKGKVCFYSLCNFSQRRPEGYTFDYETISGRHWICRKWIGIRAECDPTIPRYPYDINAKKNIIVKVDIEDKKISRVAYVPLWLNQDAVMMPVPAEDSRFAEHMDYILWMSGSQGFDVSLIPEGDEVVIKTD